MNHHLFISYSRRDGTALAKQLSDGLRRGNPPFEVWLDTTGIRPGTKFQFEIDDAIKNCRCLVYLMTPDSVSSDSWCPEEIARANRYKKTIVPIMAGKDVVPLLGFETPQRIDITDDFASGLALLREHILWTETPEGELSNA